MKRYIRGNRNIPKLKIYIDINYKLEELAASTDFTPIEHPSIKRKFKKSDEWLKLVNDLARSIIGSMKGRGFNIIKAWPSNKSYTYYIRFQPTNENGETFDQELELQIELRDHTSKTHSDIGLVNKNLLVKTYYLENKRYKDMLELLREVWAILDDLQAGDFSSFVE